VTDSAEPRSPPADGSAALRPTTAFRGRIRADGGGAGGRNSCHQPRRSAWLRLDHSSSATWSLGRHVAPKANRRTEQQALMDIIPSAAHFIYIPFSILVGVVI
jgi:hypothetical protein